MNLYHIKLTDNQKAALEHLFSLDIAWNKTELEKAWNELRYQLKESVQCVAMINALHQSDDDWETKQKKLFNLMNGRKNTETAPKHDPCRKFRKGDEVEVSRCKGRAIIPSKLKVGDKLKVCENEGTDSIHLYVKDSDGRRYFIDPAYVTLVTPVEELEPYIVTYDDKFYHIHKHGEEASIAVYSEARHPHAKEAAEAERDRLNAEHRKEQQ